MPYYLISLSLNILLTIMIAIQLIRHSRNIRNAMGSTTNNGLYNTVVTVLVESCVLYALGSLLFVAPLGAQSPVQAIFGWSFGKVQVRIQSHRFFCRNLGPRSSNRSDEQIISLYLITLRIANRTALTSRAITSGKIDSMRFRSPEEMTEDDRALYDDYLVSYMESSGGGSSEPDAGGGYIIEEVPC